MGKYDDAMYQFLSDNERFADLFNGVLFGGRQVLRAETLEGDSERYVLERTPSLKTENRFRDIKKRLKCGTGVSVLAIENHKRQKCKRRKRGALRDAFSRLPSDSGVRGGLEGSVRVPHGSKASVGNIGGAQGQGQDEGIVQKTGFFQFVRGDGKDDCHYDG